MANIAPKLQGSIGKVFNVLNTLFYEPGTEVIFLKPSSTANEFTEVTSLLEFWSLKFDKFRQSYYLEVAYSEYYFDQEVLEATHIRIGDDIYVIQEADTIPPKGLDLTWKFYCQKFTKREQFKSLY